MHRSVNKNWIYFLDSLIPRKLHRSANNGFVFVVGKRKIISGVIFDVESESESESAYHFRILRYLRLRARKMEFFATFEVMYRAQESFLVFFSNVII